MLFIEGKNKLLEVSPLQSRSPATPSELRERRDVRGADGWQVNGRGELFKHMRRKQAYSRTGMPVIDLGEQYFGPLLPAYEHYGEVFLDEIVALAFHGFPRVDSLRWWPTTGYAMSHSGHVASGMLVRHYDGNANNCRRDNLAWTADSEFYNAEDARLLRPTGLVARPRLGLFPFANHRYDEPRFTSSDSLPGWTPTESKRAAA